MYTIAAKVKSLILVLVDYRTSYLTLVQNTIINNFNTAINVQSYNPNNTNINNNNNSSKVNCIILQPKITIFSCYMHVYTNVVL